MIRFYQAVEKLRLGRGPAAHGFCKYSHPEAESWKLKVERMGSFPWRI
jgi:hypothetical protein